MNKKFPIIVVTALAAAISLTATPSLADPAGDAVGAGLLGGFLGFAAGAAVAGSAPHGYVDPGYDGDFAWRRHVRSCFRAYGDSYDPQYDTYTDYYGDDHRCHLR